VCWRLRRSAPFLYRPVPQSKLVLTPYKEFGLYSECQLFGKMTQIRESVWNCGQLKLGICWKCVHAARRRDGLSTASDNHNQSLVSLPSQPQRLIAKIST
jgi:hypothetical protein